MIAVLENHQEIRCFSVIITHISLLLSFSRVAHSIFVAATVRQQQSLNEHIRRRRNLGRCQSSYWKRAPSRSRESARLSATSVLAWPSRTAFVQHLGQKAWTSCSSNVKVARFSAFKKIDYCIILNVNTRGDRDASFPDAYFLLFGTYFFLLQHYKKWIGAKKNKMWKNACAWSV